MIVILDNIRSVYNVGSIFRTAHALGVEKIYLCGITPSPKDEIGRWRKDFIKTSLGRERMLFWEKKKSAVETVKKLKKQGYIIFAIEQSKNSISYYKQNINKKELEKSVFILGNEIKGISRGIISLADKVLEIPVEGDKKESLNVAIAFAVVGYGLKCKYIPLFKPL